MQLKINIYIIVVTISKNIQWFSPGTLVSSTYKIVHHDIAEILLAVALNTINPTLKTIYIGGSFSFQFTLKDGVCDRLPDQCSDAQQLYDQTDDFKKG